MTIVASVPVAVIVTVVVRVGVGVLHSSLAREW
jgi:hypothetical protein